MRKINFCCLLPLASLILAGCITTQPPSVISLNSYQWHQHEQKLQQIEQFQVSGSIAYFSEKQKTYARFFWQQHSEKNYRLLLTNPLGTIEFELRVQPEFTLLIDNRGKRHFSKNPQEIIQRLTGMWIPLDNLHQWMLGLPGKSQSHNFTLDNQYRLKQINYRQADQIWSVNYQSYTEGSTPLPKRIELKTQAGKKRIKLKIDSWKLHPQSLNSDESPQPTTRTTTKAKGIA
ncbi:lipoprotein insertase outer membrane protein LolB [Candidatus Regiella insecticola]|uniref:Outer-membrane lipoprotein LolB n=1 Tax=Candidatus Regiella insecticola TaxID=138073 RepID=A0A6L2ZRT6_9ENTR|nr:lipoprotein insertase outer membrane protein LolB [Candidatus Regiella insecticola]GFN46908.1 outer-membrane lipoprotein LolB [Candidatus Regiella insecticola]